MKDEKIKKENGERRKTRKRLREKFEEDEKKE